VQDTASGTPVESNGTTSDALELPLIMVPRLQFVEPISEVNGAKKFTFDVQLYMNKNSDPVQKFSSGVAGEDSAPNSFFCKLLELPETC